MRRFILSTIMMLGLVLMPVASVQAANFNSVCNDPTTAQAQSTTFCKEIGKGSGNPLGGPGGVFTSIIQIISILSGVAAVILIIIGALQYVLAAGDPSKINQAKNYILYAIIGLVVTVIAQSVVIFVLKKL
jgi:hypothetical protein